MFLLSCLYIHLPIHNYVCVSCSFVRSKESSLRNQVQTSSDQLRRLHSSRSDNLAAFGEDMRTVVNELQHRRREFRKPPKGPIGSLIQLRDHKWTTAIEQVIKYGTLRAFVVDNRQDLKTYKSICERVLRGKRYPDAIVSRFQGSAYDVRANVSYMYIHMCM